MCVIAWPLNESFTDVKGAVVMLCRIPNAHLPQAAKVGSFNQSIKFCSLSLFNLLIYVLYS